MEFQYSETSTIAQRDVFHVPVRRQQIITAAHHTIASPFVAWSWQEQRKSTPR